MHDTPEYHAWSGMRQRCYNPKSVDYKNYGGRGIKVCDRWRNSFDAFFEDMGRRPSATHCVERDDNDGDYEPGNCRWATVTEQANNKRSNRVLTHQGETLSVADWSRRTGVPSTIIRKRIDCYGWSPARAIMTKVRPMKKPTP
jgi:hypothetical protein